MEMKKENGLMMVLHSVAIGVIIYIVLFYVLKQRQVVAENRSILIAAVAVIYMVLFGHGMPTSINKNLS
jgi:hypothetical protein